MTINAYITGASTCTAEGITATGSAPLLALCRKLIERFSERGGLRLRPGFR